jgi:hypothetical protein
VYLVFPVIRVEAGTSPLAPLSREERGVSGFPLSLWERGQGVRSIL